MQMMSGQTMELLYHVLIVLHAHFSIIEHSVFESLSATFRNA
jgi:hypothetical protein